MTSLILTKLIRYTIMSKGVVAMNTNLITMIICACVALFNLYCYIAQGTVTTLILFVIWLLVALKHLTEFISKKDNNS